MQEINYTCSLGTHCQSSMILKNNKLKLCSYPFDWIFSDCDIIIDCIKDNFSKFLNKSYYINVSNTVCGHSLYKYKNENIFNHKNPLINENDYNYYLRCVDRFKKLIKKEGYKLFTMIFVNMNNINEFNKNKIKYFNNELSKYTSNYILLVILHIKNKQNNYHNFIYDDNIHFLEIHTLSESDGVNFNNNYDNEYLNNIILTYNFNLIDDIKI